MSGCRLLGLWLLCCASCAGTRGAATTPVIVAGSVCSNLPQIQSFQGDVAVSGTGNVPVVALVTDARPSELVLYDVNAARVRFHLPVKLRSRPQILGDVVIAIDDRGQLLGFDLETGARRFSAGLERPNWLGATRVGSLVISTTTSLSFRPGERGSTVTAVDARTGVPVWQRRVPYALSRPTALGERVFVISDHADVWELDAHTGADAGCARLGSEPVDWLDADAAGLWLGAGDAGRIAQPATGGPKLSLPIAQLPGRPALQASSYDSAPADRSAHGRVGLISKLEQQNGALRLAGDRYVFVFYRELFAYRADGELVWARLLDADVVRAHSAGAVLTLVGEDGSLQLLSADTGADRGRLRMAARVASADIRAEGLSVPAASELPRPLRNALAEIALDTDARLLPGRLLAVSALAALQDPLATSDLLHIYTQAGAPPALRERIAAVLPTRRVGTEYLIDALLDDYDFLEDRSAPPLAAIVPSLVAAHETRAVPRLVERLFDPDTRLPELEGLVDAIAQLGDESASQPLARFLAMYHADSSLAAEPASLVAAARALLARGGSHAELVQAVARASITLPALRATLAELLSTPAAPDAPQLAAAAAAPIAAAAAPELLSDAAVKRVFADHADDLRMCILSELARNPSLRLLRLSFVVKSDGGLDGLQVLPDHAELVQCLKSRFAGLRFPAFQGGRRLASYSVAVHSDAVSAALAQPRAAGAEQPFWRLSELRAGPTAPVPNVAPWWENRNPLFVAVDDALTPSAAPVTDPPSSTQKPDAGAAKQPEENAPPDKWWLPTAAP
jgi:outer membrane protein assembly factor BamB